MNNFQKKYRDVLNNMGGVSGTSDSKVYAKEVQNSIDYTIEALNKTAIQRENVDINYLKGWLAESWHSETLKVSAAARGRKDIYSEAPNNNETGQDFFYGKYGDHPSVGESKYYKSADETAKAISRPEYSNVDKKIVPSDQLEEIKEHADRLAKKNLLNRPEQAANYKHTAENADDRLRVENSSSKPLSEPDSKEMAKDFKGNKEFNPDKYGLKTENFVEWKDIARESGTAALNAAILSAALTAAPHIWKTLEEFIETGEVSAIDLKERSQIILHGSGAAGLRGGIAASLTASCKSGLMGENLKSISPLAIGMATTMTINAIGYSIRYQQGLINENEFKYNCIRDSFVLTTGMGGAVIGQIIIPIPLLGAMTGNLVGSTFGAVAFEGLNQVVLATCIDTGWTYFGLVDQDYTVPINVLREAGFEVFEVDRFETDKFEAEGFEFERFEVEGIGFQQLSRGIIGFNKVGYL
jgi:hypothetical protein